MIKKFENFEEETSKKEASVSERYEVQKDLYNTAMNNIHEIVGRELSDVNDMNWAHIGSLHRINETLIDIIEGWDESLANELRAKL